MGSRKVRPLLFIAAGIIIAALIGFGVWYTSSPSTSDGTSTQLSEAVPSSHTSHSSTPTGQDQPRSVAPTTSEEISHPTPFAEPDENDPFLPPNARLAAPSSIERETVVYRPTNIVPEGAEHSEGAGGSAQKEGIGSSGSEVLATVSVPGATHETSQDFAGTESATAAVTSATQPGSTVDATLTQTSALPVPPTEQTGQPGLTGQPGTEAIQPEQVPAGQPAPTEAAPSLAQVPSDTAGTYATTEPNVVPAPQPQPEPQPQPQPQPQPETQQQQVPQQPQMSNFGNVLWWQQLQGQFVR